MSIARAARQIRKVRRTLMFSAALRVLQIKDLKDLSFSVGGDTIDMQDLKDLKRCLSFATVWGTRTIAGDRPPRYGEKKRAVYRRARACPSPCKDRGGQAPALRSKEKSRGTGPRATVGKAVPFPRDGR